MMAEQWRKDRDEMASVVNEFGRDAESSTFGKFAYHTILAVT